MPNFDTCDSTLATWFGVSAVNLSVVLSKISLFSKTKNPGYMG
ncbi:MAG: hypothetical protein Q8N18_02035 [Opitutaceae bacterium]|nr:hypothetical protein [Opitutaceae bacterium]